MSAHFYQYPIKTHPQGVNTFADLQSHQIVDDLDHSSPLSALRTGLDQHRNRPADERLWDICQLDQGATIRDAISACASLGQTLEFGVINIFNDGAEISKLLNHFGIIPQGELELAAASNDVITVYTTSSYADEISTLLRSRMDDYILIDSTDSWALVFYHSSAVCLHRRDSKADHR